MKRFGVTILSFFMVIMISIPVLAQTTPPSTGTGIEAVIMNALNSIPVVGSILAFVAKWGGLIAGLFTSLSLAVIAVLKTPELLAQWAGAQALADKIAAFSEEVIPWFKYLSMFNVQKPVAKPLPKPVS